MSFTFQINAKLPDPDGNTLTVNNAGIGSGTQASPTNFLDVFTPPSNSTPTTWKSQIWTAVPDPANPGYFFLESALSNDGTPKGQLVINISGVVTATSARPNGILANLDIFPQDSGWHGNQVWKTAITPESTVPAQHVFIQSNLNDSNGTPYVMNISGTSTAASPPAKMTRVDTFPQQALTDRQLWSLGPQPGQQFNRKVTLAVLPLGQTKYLQINGTGFVPGPLNIPNFTAASTDDSGPGTQGPLPCVAVNFDGSFETTDTGLEILTNPEVNSVYIYIQMRDSGIEALYGVSATVDTNTGQITITSQGIGV